MVKATKTTRAAGRYTPSYLEYPRSIKYVNQTSRRTAIPMKPSESRELKTDLAYYKKAAREHLKSYETNGNARDLEHYNYCVNKIIEYEQAIRNIQTPEYKRNKQIDKIHERYVLATRRTNKRY